VSEVAGELSAARVGAEVLLDLARARAEGTLVWQRAGGPVHVALKGGRPEHAVAASKPAALRADIVRLVRAFAAATAGAFRFTDGAVATAVSPPVDPLGEALMAILAMTEAALAPIWQARTGLAVAPSASFDKLVAALTRLQATPPAIPADGTALEPLALAAGPAEQRALAALLLLGGLSTKPLPEPRPAPAVVLSTQARDPKLRAILADIEAKHASLPDQSHSDGLGVARDADVDTIRKAYLEAAKRWHSDSFAGVDLGPAARLVEGIFRRIGEAQRILGDPEQRKTYDFILDRHAKGLPTDPGAILEAEALFRRAEGLVRRGQAAAALAPLQRAVELNKGEPEFWVYLGFALYFAKGSGAVAEARGYIQQGLELKAGMDVAYEFLGRIARVEGNPDEAIRHLRRALELNPKNREVERELRLIAMRGGKSASEPRSLGELVKKLLKRS